MMGKRGEQWSLFYQFRLDERVPKDRLPSRMDGFETMARSRISTSSRDTIVLFAKPSVRPVSNTLNHARTLHFR